MVREKREYPSKAVKKTKHMSNSEHGSNTNY